MLHLKDNTKKPKSTQTNATRRLIALRLHTKEFAEVEEMARKQDRSIASLARVCLRIGMQQIQSESEA